VSTFREFRRLVSVTDPKNDLTPDDVDQLRIAAVRLDRFRSAETSEFIDLVQDELLEWIDGRTPDPNRRSIRETRLVELRDQLWGSSGAAVGSAGP
jgi:hypothetical protein